MKKIFMNGVVIIVVCLTGSINAQWFPQNYPNPNSTIKEIFAIDEFTAVAVGGEYGNGGIVLQKTIDGVNWIRIPLDSTSSLNSVYFVNDTVGWISGSGYPERAIQKTTDGGINWTGQFGSYDYIVYSIQFLDENTGWAAGLIDRDFPTYYTLKTTDGGTNWIYQNLPVPIVSRIFFTNHNTGWIVGNSNVWGGGGAILKTTDAGINWISESTVDYRINSIHFVDENIGWMAGWDYNSGLGMVGKTTDGGETWENQSPAGINTLEDIYFVDEYMGWVVGTGGIILHTTDGSENWISQESGTSNNLLSVHFANENTGWAVGENGTILKTINGGVMDLTDNNNSVQPADFFLHQNYPNPFNPITNISYILPSESQVKLSIYNPLGELVETIVNEKQNAGKYDAVWNAGTHPSGVYIYTLDAVSLNGDNQTKISKKMLLLK